MSEANGLIHVALTEHGAGKVATVTIDHVGRANAMNSTLCRLFAESLGALAGLDDLRAAVVTGAGDRAFIAGADVGEMAGLDPDGARRFIEGVHGCCRAIRDLPVPVLARIGGHAFGAGLEIAAACDGRIAVERAKFGMPEVRLGIPSVVEAALLPQLVGWGRTRWMLLSGETFGAADAARWGLVEEVVAADALDAAVAAWTTSMLAGRPRAMRLQKALIRRWEDLPPTAAIAAGVEAFADAYATEEPRAAMAAFLAARR